MSAPDYSTLYQFEKLISETLASLFNNAQLTAIGISDDPQFQKARPRVEVNMTQNGSLEHHFILDAQGQRRENGWRGTFTLACITAPQIAIHSAYLGAVRNVAATVDQLDLANPPGTPPQWTPLQYHEIDQICTAGSSHNWKPEEGFYETQLHYDFIFAVRADAWPFGLLQSYPALPITITDGLLTPIIDESGAIVYQPWRDTNGQLWRLHIVDGILEKEAIAG